MSDWHNFGIYLIENTCTNKVYIGSTSRTFRERKNEHWSALTMNKHRNPVLQNVWNKYGKDAFQFHIVEVIADATSLIEREQYWIDFYTQQNRCCNVGPAESSRLGVPHSEETKRRLSESTQKQMKSSGARKRISDSIKALWRSDEYRQRVIDGSVGRKASLEAREQRAFRAKEKVQQSQEYKDRLDRMRKIRWNNPDARKKMSDKAKQIWQSSDIRARHVEKVAKVYDGFISPEGVIYRNIKNLMAFCREHGLNSRTMSDVYYGKRNHHKKWKRYYPDVL